MKHFFLFIFLSLALSLASQKQGNIWYFGDQAGLTFNGGGPVALTNGQLGYGGGINHMEGTTAISDSSGALLFYSNGQTIWNKAHQVMVNGTGLLGNYSSTQSSIIVPQPGDSSRYFYIFTISSGFCCNGSINDGLRYSKIDMCLDSSRGAVIVNEKNIKLVDTVAEKLAVCRHANGVDYWILTHKFYSDKFVALQLTAAGITNTVITSIGSMHGNLALGNIHQTQGQMKLSPNGQRIAVGSSNGGDILDVFNFNTATGVVSGWMPLFKPNNDKVSVYGVEFSPDNSKLYARGLTSMGLMYELFFQYDLLAGGGNINAINSSVTIIDQDMSGLILGPGLQLGPNGRIYSPSINNFNALSEVSNPNVAGLGCNYQDQTISLNGRTVSYSLPTFIANYDYSNGMSLPPNVFVVASTSANCGSPGSATVSIVSGPMPPTYSWTPSAQTGSMATNLAGNYTVMVKNPIGCASTQTLNVPFLNNLSATVSVVAPSCNNSADGTAQVLTAPSGTYTYSWSGSAQTASNVTGLSAGSHTVIITSTSVPCTYTASFQLVDPPPMNLPLSSSTVCAGQTLSLSAGIFPGASYSWAGPGGFSSSQPNILLPSANATMSGVYTLTLTDVGGCKTTASTIALVIPAFTVSITSNTPCLQGLLTLNTGTAGSYQWLGPAGFTSTLQSPAINNAGAPAAGVYSLVSTIGSCTAGATAQVTLHPLPSPLTSATLQACETASLQLTVSNSGTSYDWTGPGNYTSAAQNPVIASATPANTGVYTVTVTDANNCQASASTSVTVIGILAATAVPANACQGEEVTLSATGGSVFAWAGPANFSAAGPIIHFTAALSLGGIYTLTTFGNPACPSTATVQVSVKALPSGSLAPIPDLCVPDCRQLVFHAGPNSPPVIQTSFMVNNQALSDTANNYCFKTAGIYRVRVNFKDFACANSATMLVNAFETPVADFDFIPKKPLAGIDQVHFTNTSTGNEQNRWTWFFIDNDQDPLRVENTSYLFPDAGQFPVALIVSNSRGCTDTVVKTVLVENEFSLYVPNAFTPDADGLNDLFQPKGMGIKNYVLMVYDRWGERLFETTDFLSAWDGSFKGKSCKEDVYQWKIEATGTDGKIRQMNGHVTLYR